MNFFRGLIEQSQSRIKESTLGVLGIKNHALRSHIESQFEKTLGTERSFLATPAFEHTFGWESGSTTFAELSGSLLQPSLVKTLDEAQNYRFPKDLKPYKHQVEAWRALAEKQPRSTVITTGTGSGKTECFMVPILNDLIQEYQEAQQPLVGVRALFLYPLNALINSQQERLDAWTRDFEGKLRFCLYNGKTENSASKVRKEQAIKPNQILSRELLRKEPAPILMTNSTMLEYMLIRQVDSPILDISKQQQSLRWIVLDEAHTYVGSQAAELSLLLKRVVQAFGRESNQIRFVATSATIADTNASEKLQQYLADLAGVPAEQVTVITGKRVWPLITERVSERTLTLDEIIAMEPESEVSERRFDNLAGHPLSKALREHILQRDKPQTLDALVDLVSAELTGQNLQEKQQEVIRWLDVMTGTKREKKQDPFLKVRAHFFQRMLHGLWACVNSECACKPSLLSNFPFGQVYISERSRCECGSPVFELAFCGDCSEPHLLAADVKGKLSHRAATGVDEFSLNIETEIADENEEMKSETSYTQSSNIVIAPTTNKSSNYLLQTLDIDTAEVGVQSGKTINIYFSDEAIPDCSRCSNAAKNSAQTFYRQAHLGGPFYVANAVPTVLEYCPDPEKSESKGRSPEELPGRGRKLITFTDSRQGTARMAVRMQQEAERSRLRGLVFKTLQINEAKSERDSPRPVDLEKEIAEKESIVKALEIAKQFDLVSKVKEEIEALRLKSGGAPSPSTVLVYRELLDALTEEHDINNSILRYNRYANPALFGEADGPRKLAELLVAREFSRRPKYQNSAETLGLISVDYAGLEKINRVPEYWSETQAQVATGAVGDYSSLSLDDWRDFIKVALDFYVRENTFISLNPALQSWMGSRFSQKYLYSPKANVQEDVRNKKWPQVKSQKHRLVRLLELATGLDTRDPSAKDKINFWLEKAWDTLVNNLILDPSSNGHQLKLSSLQFYLPKQAWVCPVTHRLIDTTFRGLTPYLPRKLVESDYRSELIELPRFTDFLSSETGLDRLTAVREKVHANTKVQELRADSLWSDISDRTMEGGFYYRTAEHSAQQSSKTLDNYETLFKKGDINVLNCSTTMEMGVDIGGISAVVMNNVPPHPANYLQRAGRAGRRSESRAIAYTLCKGNPHNQRAFRNPLWPFTTAIPAPKVTLSSKTIVQRHVNALILATYLKTLPEESDRTRLSSAWFFGNDSSPCMRMMSWLDTNLSAFSGQVKSIVFGTCLAGMPISNLVEEIKIKLSELNSFWVGEQQNIIESIEKADDEPYRRALEFELEAHNSQFLLKELTAHSFLPGHGFPTDVVELNHKNIEDFKESRKARDDSAREDNVFVNKEKPSRSLNIALREYAPGATLVVDGRVYRSAGIALKDYANLGNQNTIRFDIAWRCDKCGTTGLKENAYSSSKNLKCTNTLCREPISARETTLTLRPTGFLTDFWEPTSNDILSQKFIPVADPRVNVVGEIVPLPDKNCGFVRFGHQGHVFHHTKGEHGNGFAVCLACGKAESMTDSGSIPSVLAIDKEHRPIGGATGSKKERTCSGAHVKSDIALGYQVKTDVLEICLRNPKTTQWLSNSAEDKIIARTMAVAIREVIADELGIASSEIGFAQREEKDFNDGVARSVIQLFDEASGGAGFVLNALNDIVGTLRKARVRLDCPASCDTVCAKCLASNDSRIERNEIDRNLAIDWLEDSGIFKHLELPPKFSVIDQARYCSSGINRTLNHFKNLAKSSDKEAHMIVPLHGDSAMWDFGNSNFRTLILNWIVVDKIAVTLAIPKATELTQDIRQALLNLKNLGVNLSFIKNSLIDLDDIYLGFQIQSKKKTVNLYSDNADAVTVNDSWIADTQEGIWVSSEHQANVLLEPCDISSWTLPQDQSISKVIDVREQLDGYVLQLPERLALLLKKQYPRLIDLIKNDTLERITYTDRYLKNPWTSLLMASLIGLFKGNEPKEIEINAVTATNDREGYLSFHDWQHDYDQKAFIEHLLEETCPARVTVNLAKKVRELQHARKLNLVWSSGKTTEVTLDQGFGYWECYSNNRSAKRFPFEESPHGQLTFILEARQHLQMKHMENWPTMLTFSEKKDK